MAMSTRRRLFKFPGRSGATIARDVDDELSFHFDMRVAELKSGGLSDDAAQQQARTEFGDLEFTRRYCRNQDESAARNDRRADRGPRTTRRVDVGQLGDAREGSGRRS